MDEHELLCAVKGLASELDRTPTLAEFQDKFSRHHMTRVFGSYTVMLQRAGLDPVRKQTKEKITNEVFLTDVREHLASHDPPKLLMAKPYPKIMSISDIHWPFEMEAVIEGFIKAVKLNQPDYVVLNGDAFDMYSAAKFPRSHNQFTPKDEERLSREKNEDFWKRVKEAAPSAHCYQMLGNHDLRPLKRVLETVPAIEHWAQKYMEELFTFDGVTTIHDARQELKIGNVLVLHGYRTKLGDHRDFMRTNCITGHTHRGGVVFRNAYDVETNSQFVIFEANSGYAGNPRAKGLTYTPQRIQDWTWGWVEVDPRGPRFVPA